MSDDGSPAAPSPGVPKCLNHPDRIATAACEKCMVFLCDECASTVDEEIVCPNCRLHAPGEADAQPASSAEAKPAAEAPVGETPAAGPKCKNHPDRAPAAACQKCKAFLCEECATNIAGQIFCPECRASAPPAVPAEPAPSQAPVSAQADDDSADASGGAPGPPAEPGSGLILAAPTSEQPGEPAALEGEQPPESTALPEEPRPGLRQFGVAGPTGEESQEAGTAEAAMSAEVAPAGGLKIDPRVVNEIVKMVTGSVIIGAICGFAWGRLYDPWGQQGPAAALLNLFLFGGWAVVEVGGVLAARKLNLAKNRGLLILAGAFCGGLYVALFTALNTAAKSAGGLAILVGLVIGFGLGFAISAVCTIRLSGLLRVPAPAGAGGAEAPGPAGAPAVLGAPPPAPTDQAGDQGMALSWKIAIGVGACLTFIVLIVGLLVFIGGLGYQAAKSKAKKEQQEKAAALQRQKAARYIPKDRKVFTTAKPKGNFYLKVNNKRLKCRIKSTSAVLSTSAARGRHLLITVDYETVSRDKSTLQIKIHHTVFDKIKLETPILLNDPRPTGDPNAIDVQFNYRPVPSGFSSKLGAAGSERHAERRQVVFGKLSFREFGQEKGKAVKGILEAQLVPYGAFTGAAEKSIAKLRCRFKTKLGKPLKK